jgi:hypothetical protein
MRMMMIVMISRRIASLWIVLLLISCFSYHYIATVMSSTITAEDCSNFDMAQLYFTANEVAKKADDYLSPYFRSIYEGQWRVALDEKQGLRNGGFTNMVPLSSTAPRYSQLEYVTYQCMKVIVGVLPKV